MQNLHLKFRQRTLERRTSVRRNGNAHRQKTRRKNGVSIEPFAVFAVVVDEPLRN